MEFKLESSQYAISKDQLQQDTSVKTKSTEQTGAYDKVVPHQQVFSNGYANQMFFNRYARSQYIVAAAVTINLSLILVYFQLSIQDNPMKTWLLYMTTILQFFCIFILYFNYIIYNQYKTQENRLYQLKKPIELAFYTFTLLVKPYPFLEDYSISFQNQLRIQIHKVNDLLCIFSLVEVFLIAPALFVCARFHSIRSQRITQMYGARASYLYALKCWFKENSGFVVALTFSSWFMICAFAIRMAQYTSTDKGFYRLKSMQNSIWLTFITMATVGFGDQYPLTNIGFIVNTFSMYSGVIILSITVMLLRNLFDLTPRQRRTLVIMNSLEQKNQLRAVACSYIRESLWRLWRNKKRALKGYQPCNSTLQERNLKVRFKTIRRESQRINYQSNVKDQFTSNFAKVFGYMNNLNDNADSMIHFFHTKRS